MNRDYYGGDDPYEAIKVIRAWGLNFALGSVLKYIKRHGNKPGEDAITCLTKARDYLDDEINALRAANTPDRPTTPEPETSPAKPGSSASQDGLRVGARVRAVTEDTYNGLMGVIVEGTERWFSVKLDTNMITTPRDFSDHELVVIG